MDAEVRELSSTFREDSKDIGNEDGVSAKAENRDSSTGCDDVGWNGYFAGQYCCNCHISKVIQICLFIIFTLFEIHSF